MNGELETSHAGPEVKEVQEMYGEACREAGTLVLVFVPIYVLIEDRSGKTSWLAFLLAMVVGIALLWFGIKLERMRLRA